ncbi:MAG: Eco57I restriction-modification methylase domain-containing protein [Prevotella sp.]|nr:Eco57I restriction-modification methylase domain-containing protein [Prevotella sp.]
MEFNKAYNRQEFVHFLQHSFLPDDFLPTEEPVTFWTKMTYSTQAVKLGTSAELDLVVYEVMHKSKNNARVSLSKEAFRMLADETVDRALVIFVPEDNSDNYRFSLIEITLEGEEDSSRVRRNYSDPRRYSYFLGEGIACYTPNKYLNGKGRVIDADDLRSRFSVEVLTKEFYNELSDWYAWAIKNMRFPNDLNDKTDDDKYNNESAIRLITRLIFVWFLKQRHLIPDEFFDEQYIANNLIEGFNPNAMVDLISKSTESKYYKAILQNLFFAMLNSPITAEGSDELSERHFRKKGGDYDNNKLMRYECYFKNPQLFVDLANRTVPFLNGGLFDCLDEKDKDLYYDSFTDRKDVSRFLIVPDYLFFGEEAGKNIDLSEWYGDKKKKKVSARGIIDILKRYNFTVEENTPFDQEVSLDPELLGKVFENLLASYNPETQTTARKQTGSFYTPREIVQYMVNESLVAHLKRTVGEELEPQFRLLLQYSDDPVGLSIEQRKSIMQSLYNCKILDPACGSGAFPMGILQQMVHILNRIDPGNTQWREMMLNKAINETSEAYRTASSDERKDMIADIERSFDENINRPDYARKLYLIENCIYGVDIQPIAIQISKLRFFISLVVDQMTNNNPADNFGIRPLPNLEAKFVAANTLIGLDKKNVSLFDSDAIKAKEKELKTAKHKIFGAKTVKTKRKYRQIVNDLRLEIADMLKDCGAVGNAEALQLASWDMFNQNTSSPFFDPEWMFGVKDKFSIIITNPPFIDSENMVNQGMAKLREYLVDRMDLLHGNWDMYMAFLELSLSLAHTVVYITPDKWLSKPFGEKFREKAVRTRLSAITHAGSKVFESATVDAVITVFIEHASHIKAFVFSNEKELLYMNNYRLSELRKPYLLDFLFSENANIISKIDSNKLNLTDLHITCEGACATSEAYKLLPIVQSEKAPDSSKTYKLINTGTLVKYGNLWGKKNITYLGFKDLYPVVDKMKFAKTSGRTYVNRAKYPKLIFKGLNLLDVFLDEYGEFIPGKTTLIICSDDARILRFICGFLNSKLVFWYLKIKYSSSSYCGGITFTKDMINNIHIPVFKESDINKVIEVVDNIINIKKDNVYVDIRNLEQQIDLLVYRLYGLTYDEVLIVDPQTPIIREDYERMN